MNLNGTIEKSLLAKKINGKCLARWKALVNPALGAKISKSLYVVINKHAQKSVFARKITWFVTSARIQNTCVVKVVVWSRIVLWPTGREPL